MADAEDRTHAATPRRLQRARADGQVALSPEVAPAVLLAELAGWLAMRAPGDLHAMATGLAATLAQSGRTDGPAGVAGAVARLARAVALPLAEVFALAMAVALAATLAQTGLLLNLSALAPDLSRLSPGRGLRRLFGAQGLVRAATSLLKLAVVGAAMWRLLHARLPDLATAVMLPPQALPARLGDLTHAVLLAALAAQGLIALADVGRVRWRHAGSLRMSLHDLREESRDADGNPQVKAKLRRLRSQRARRRMAQAVRTATVVITNPTHYAVALSYDRTRNAAPTVVAKGMDEMAARIRALAREAGVPLVANPPLARALHRVELDSDIPAEHYQAVAELIAYVWRLRGQAPGSRAGVRQP